MEFSNIYLKIGGDILSSENFTGNKKKKTYKTWI